MKTPPVFYGDIGPACVRPSRPQARSQVPGRLSEHP